MPAGYGSRCKTCNSPHRLQIEAWKREGLSAAAISTRLKEMGVSISERALDSHFKDHYNVQAEAWELYAKSQAQMEQDVQDALHDLKVLDNLVRSKYKIHQKLDHIFTELLSGLAEKDQIREAITFKELPKIPLAYVNLYTGCAAEIRQALAIKQKLLGEDPETKKAMSLVDLVELACSEGPEES